MSEFEQEALFPECVQSRSLGTNPDRDGDDDASSATCRRPFKSVTCSRFVRGRAVYLARNAPHARRCHAEPAGRSEPVAPTRCAGARTLSTSTSPYACPPWHSLSQRMGTSLSPPRSGTMCREPYAASDISTRGTLPARVVSDIVTDPLQRRLETTYGTQMLGPCYAERCLSGRCLLIERQPYR
jgi:hypothetical protein